MKRLDFLMVPSNRGARAPMVPSNRGGPGRPWYQVTGPWVPKVPSNRGGPGRPAEAPGPGPGGGDRTD